MKKKDVITIVLAVFLLGLFAYSFPDIGKTYINLPQENKHLFNAITVSGIGLVIYFLKKRKDITPEMYTAGEFFQILMFMIIPVFATFEILKDEIKEQPVLIPIIYLSTIGLWYFISLNQLNKEYSREEGKNVKFLVDYFSAVMIAFGVGITVVIMWLNSFK